MPGNVIAWGLKDALSLPSGEKIDIVAEKVPFLAKISHFKVLNSGIRHSFRGLTYMSVCISSSTIRIY